ncbi:MAG TPA: diphosphomevalonate decarboxylase [Polyangiaceae bacterium]|nr:diphosphomevalonate decarboxylase [Polyangiaceae bacterium]
MTLGEAVAIAHPNVALSKYWGKREGGGNFPAVPSLSVTLAGLTTRTRVRWRHDVAHDRVVLNGRTVGRDEAPRVFFVIDRVRRKLGLDATADVETGNDFPTASGLASSASGFAALALASVRAAGAEWDGEQVSDLARRGSASAARSVFGGFVELDAGPAAARVEDTLSARCVAPVGHLPLTVLVCVTAEGAKEIGSTEGMQATMSRSPYASAWLELAPRLHARIKEALLARDFLRVGELAERSALAMHACAIAAGVTYWNAGTLDTIAAVKELRRGGMAAYFTIDAGPHVKVLVTPTDAAAARAALERVAGVRRIIPAAVGEGARVDDASPGVVA